MEALPDKSLTALVVLTLLWFLEGWIPFFSDFNQFGKRLSHAWKNLAVGAINAMVLGALFAGTMVFLISKAQGAGFGLLLWLQLPPWLEIPLAILIFDAWMYTWHRMNHVVPFLWRFHQIHHSDPRMDVTSAVRFHPGEIALSFLTRFLVVPILGMTLWELALYESILLPVILLHHSNVALSDRADAALRLVIVSPNMHRIHHSNLQPETDSNYSSIFSWWDRILGSHRKREDYRSIQYGLEELTDSKWHTLKGIFETPFRNKKK